MLAVEVVGLIIMVTGLILLVVPRMSAESKFVVPGVTINAPASVLVLIVGVAVFLFPYSPWWPQDGPGPSASASPTPSAATAPLSTASATASTAPPPSITPSIAPSEPTTSVLPASVVADCIPYDPASLTIEDLGATGWRLNSSTSAMLLTDTQADAQKALKLAQLNTKHCFIGRGNQRANRFDYIVTFWTGPGGSIVSIPAGVIPGEDCIGYDPANLSIENLGTTGWRLDSGPIAMVLADTVDDANNLKALAGNYAQQCFIGRNNSRSDRLRYIVDYWK